MFKDFGKLMGSSAKRAWATSVETLSIRLSIAAVLGTFAAVMLVHSSPPAPAPRKVPIEVLRTKPAPLQPNGPGQARSLDQRGRPTN